MSSAPSTSVANSHKSGSQKTPKEAKDNKKVHTSTKNVAEKHEKVVNENVASDSNTKHQPTAEQMRLANLMNDKTDFNELQTKVEKIIELTGSTKDEAVVALHDCDGNLLKAVNMIFEGDPVNEAEWKSSSRKKKKQTPVIQTAGKETSKDNGESVSTAVNGDKSRGAANSGRGGRGAPRLQRGKGIGGPKSTKTFEHKHQSLSTNDNENQENATPNATAGTYAGGPNQRRGGENRRGRGRGGGPKGSRGGGGDRGRGTRTFQNRGYRSNNMNAGPQNDDTFPNSIDTWTNSTVDNKASVNNDCTTMTVGNWSDIAGNEDWSEEDWDSNLMETKVFTPSAKTLQEKDELNELSSSNVPSAPTNQNVGLVTSLMHKRSGDQPSQQPPPQTQQQPPINQMINTNVTRNASSNAGATLLQQIQATSQAPSQVNQYAMNYSKQATESIKSLVGIPSSTAYNSSGSGGILPSTNLDNQNALGHVRNQANLSHNELAKTQQQQQSQPQQQQQASSRLPPQKRPTKIPESAVEMPSNETISSLNVQFGALDFGNDNFTLNSDTATFHDTVNVVAKQKPLQPSAPTTANNLSSTLLPENTYRPTTASVDTTSMAKSSAVPMSTTDLNLANVVVASQNEAVLDRKTTTTTYTHKPIETQQQQQQQPKTALYPTSTSQIHPQTTATSDISGYKTASYTSQPADVSNVYGSSYGSVNAYVFPQTTNQMGYSGVNYSTYSAGTTTGVTQKAGGSAGTLKDVDTSGTQKHAYTDLQNVQGSMGLVSNSTVTTNVLKNSVPATGKGIPNVPPGCPPVLGTQYIMGQAGVPAFYPLYDVQMPPREHNFSYTGNTDVKYSRADDGSSVVSTQSQQMSQQAHPGHIFGQLPPGYGFFYTPSVNMVPQNLYGAATPLFPVSPATNTHAASAGSAFPKGATAYGSHSYASAGYDSLNSVPQPDYVKQSYGSTGSQQIKAMTTGNSGDLTTNQLYGKSHAQLTKSYDKASFQTGTPPPFQTSFGATPSQFIQMLPQTQTSMLHHSLQGDGSQSGSSGVGVSRQISQSQKNSGPNSTKYYNNWA